MREIKFRAWEKESKTMDYNREVTELYGGVNDYFKLSKKEGVIFMQFTGLLDKNRKKIYEGDILQNEYGKFVVYYFQFDCQYVLAEHLVMIKECSYSQVLSKKDLVEEDMKIIGNIYENPKLLS